MSDNGSQQIMYIRDGGVGERSMMLGTVKDLAREMETADHADYSVTEVYALDQMGELKRLEWSVATGPFGEDDFATGRVKAVFPNGRGEIGYYKIDGRA